MPVSGKVLPGRMKRVDRPLYHPRAIREALANAFCHRDYAVPGAFLSVAVYNDRMEIINPGTLHFGITVKALFKPHESRPWNPIIANVFYRAGIIEKWGTGTLNIIEWCKENRNPPPEWSIRSGSVVLIFKPSPQKTIQQLESRQESQPESLRDRVIPPTQSPTQSADPVIRLIGILLQGPLSSGELRQQLNLKHRPTFRKNYLHPALKEGYIEMTIPEKPKSRLQKYRLTPKGKAVIDNNTQMTRREAAVDE